MMLLDPDNGQIIDANHAAESFYGYSHEQLKSMRIFDINTLPPEKLELEIQNAQFRQRTHFLFQHRLFDGTLRDVEVYCSKIQIRNKRLLQTIVHDITEKNRLEQELIHAKDKAEENDRLKTAFLNNISHEIRTPLNAIVGFSNFLGDPNLSAEKRKEFTEIINLSSGQLLSIITDIITVATLEAGQERLNKRETDINGLLISLYEQFHHKSLHPDITLQFVSNLDQDQSLVLTDGVKLMQVLTNLVGNAFKFTKKGSIEIDCSVQQDILLFKVMDTGIGIVPELQERIFERFIQADSNVNREFGGTGLGLAISKAYVELMGGTIWVHSIPGQGSTFSFTIPFKPVRPIIENANNTEMNVINPGNSGKTILVAEDEINNYLLIREMLNDGMLKIIRAEDGQQAVEACEQHPEINLVLMDIKMPVLDGIEAAGIIKSRRPGLPIIAITAYALDTDRRRILEAGFDEYLSKPMKKLELIKMVRQFF
jgi:PAS domain S-box-containing protein